MAILERSDRRGSEAMTYQIAEKLLFMFETAFSMLGSDECSLMDAIG